LKECNIARHYNSKHSIKYKNFVNALRREKLAALKRGLESQPNLFREQSSVSSSALRARYRVAHLLATESKPFFRWGIRKKIFTTHSARDMFVKRNCS
jgi:hypothetical protein